MQHSLADAKGRRNAVRLVVTFRATDGAMQPPPSSLWFLQTAASHARKWDNQSPTASARIYRSTTGANGVLRAVLECGGSPGAGRPLFPSASSVLCLFGRVACTRSPRRGTRYCRRYLDGGARARVPKRQRSEEEEVMYRKERTRFSTIPRSAVIGA